VQLDRTNADEVMKFNEQLESYLSLYDPSIEKQKKATYEDKAKVFDDFKQAFTLKRAQGGKLKNFQKAQ
jgi:hypothetical protein